MSKVRQKLQAYATCK